MSPNPQRLASIECRVLNMLSAFPFGLDSSTLYTAIGSTISASVFLEVLDGLEEQGKLKSELKNKPTRVIWWRT